MLPYIPEKNSNDKLLLKPLTNGSPSHRSRLTEKSHEFQSTTSDLDGDVNLHGSSEESSRKSHIQIQITGNRKRSQPFAASSPKARRTGLYRQTTLFPELSSPCNTLRASARQRRRTVTRLHDESLSNSQTSGSTKSNKLPKIKTPQYEENHEGTTNFRAIESYPSVMKSYDKETPGKLNAASQELLGSPRKSRIVMTSSREPSVQIISKAKGNMSFSQPFDSEKLQKSCSNPLSSDSDSEDPLTLSLPVCCFHSKTPNTPQSPQNLKSLPAFLSSTRSTPQLSHKSNIPAAYNKYARKEQVPAESQEIKISYPFETLRQAHTDVSQPVDTIEPQEAVVLRPYKKKTKSSEEKKSRKKNVRRHKEVPVPSPIYYPFKCEWEGCCAELMNMEILRKHVYAAHSKKLLDGGRRCLWSKCGKSWNACEKNVRQSEFDHQETNTDLRLIYRTRKKWKEHMEECHMIPFSWHMGDGPCGSRLAKPSSVWQQSYLYSVDGQQATPSVASQPIEEGIVSKLNANRFCWRRGSGPLGGDILVPISQMDSPTCSSFDNSTGGDDEYIEDEENFQKVFELNQTKKIRNVNRKKLKQDEEESSPSDS